ncbi:hypothetical protein RF55_14803 [Lasius niger]|uniref:Uncharacterized protein n=1 Tax=Lasius niger TaxID=67767 RepID=A0A0J7K702_LASNI|nr:hypothetical protein RF55_14803 [Lasius niger]
MMKREEEGEGKKEGERGARKIIEGKIKNVALEGMKEEKNTKKREEEGEGKEKRKRRRGSGNDRGEAKRVFERE